MVHVRGERLAASRPPDMPDMHQHTECHPLEAAASPPHVATSMPMRLAVAHPCIHTHCFTSACPENEIACFSSAADGL